MDQSQIDRILEMTNIVDVIGEYFPLKRTGSNYKSRCPFHDEKTASFVVSEKKQIFKCFGCGKGGNAATFVRDYEKISFIDALKKLANRVGITVQNTSKKKDTKRDLIYKIYQLTVDYYHQNLHQFGRFPKEYLQKREISAETINKFQIGYALDSFAGLKNYLLKNQINSKILAETGLFTSNNSDLFRERLMFPIYDHIGKVIAFGGRILHENQGGGKYVNSPTTSIYTKGNELYGLNITKYDIAKKDVVFVCEGYTDFLRLYENGFTNSVASLGTSLTDGQINLLSRYTANIVMLYDGDKAGKKAAIRASSNILKFGMSAKIVDFPNDADPDNFIVDNGVDEMQTKISQAKSLSVFLKNDISQNLNEKQKLFLLLEVMNEIEDEISKELFIKELGEVFAISEHAIYSKVKSPKRQNMPQKSAEIHLDKFQDEKDVLMFIIDSKIEQKKVAQSIDSSYFFKEEHKKIFEFLMNNFAELNDLSSKIEQIGDENIKNMIAGFLILEAPQADCEKVLNGLKIRKMNFQLAEINRKIKEGTGNLEYYSQKNELKKKIAKLNKKVVNRTLY
ncbi:MAG: DNA primase [Candidatus Cloacimonetes bacterium]|jgi:DNA primase|nr:DNA primase [Candidatus Cloacimonadota bacterium]MBT6994469.1 DNA primase [Candidatus Cloacimonadota bacterium]MBT7470252.1 DNA primase [Candidatus Cloacimonadota bacterium]